MGGIWRLLRHVLGSMAFAMVLSVAGYVLAKVSETKGEQK